MSTLSPHNVGVDLQFGLGAITSRYRFSNQRPRLAVTRKAHDETLAASRLPCDALMDATCRVALAGYLHDLGKLAERAGAFDDASDKWRANVHLYCPFHQEGGYHSHRHAAATALALDAIEHLLPPILHGDVAPFANRGSDGDPTDSFINAAAMHHKPETFLQWCIATADRVASGFEREVFERYNRTREEHITARLLTPFEEYGAKRATSINELKWRYPLEPLSVVSLFPEAAKPAADKASSTASYAALWRHLREGLELIPRAHRDHWPLWLDAFDALWLSATHAVPFRGRIRRAARRLAIRSCPCHRGLCGGPLALSCRARRRAGRYRRQPARPVRLGRPYVPADPGRLFRHSDLHLWRVGLDPEGGDKALARALGSGLAAV